MAYTDPYESDKYSSSELHELGVLQGKAEDAKSYCDHDAASFYYDEMGKIHDRVEKREKEAAKSELMKEVREVMKLPASRRNEHYVKVKKERGSKAAENLVSAVRKQRQLGQGMEI
jgi:hypothetical protein